MQILVNADSHIEGSAELTNEVETIVQQTLRRFGERMPTTSGLAAIYRFKS